MKQNNNNKQQVEMEELEKVNGGKHKK